MVSLGSLCDLSYIFVSPESKCDLMFNVAALLIRNFITAGDTILDMYLFV